jgi:predicted metalloendopeptidase
VAIALGSPSAAGDGDQARPTRAALSFASTVDPTIAPGDDFFAYANGAWLKQVVIPKGKERWTVRDDINERTRQQVAAILDEARTAAPGSLPRKVADFRASLENEQAIEARGLESLKPMLARIDGVADRLALTRLLGATMRADVDPLELGVYASSSVLGFAVEHGIHGEPGYDAFLVQGGLGLGERDAYLAPSPDAVDRRRRYQDYVTRVLALAGLDRTDERAASVLALEAALAASQATAEASAVDRNADHRWTRADFAREAPGMDWGAFLDAAGLGRQPIVVAWQPSAMTGVAALVADRPIEAWKDYLRFHTIDRYADVLPRAVADASRAFRGDQRTREARALARTQTAMTGAIGQLYAVRYFPPAEKARVRRIVTRVAAAFRAHAAKASWMSPASRAIAVAKLDALYVGIGYPETWEDWSDLRVDAADAIGNLQRADERVRRHALARLAAPFDRREWALAPQTAGAILNFQQNAYLFAAALLQPPKYDRTASDAAAYGAIGAIIGHDLSHFVDTLGADYEPDGRMRRWWTAADAAGFEAAAAPLDRQFSACEPRPGLHVDGRLTRTENVADLAGLVAAFEAHRAALGSHLDRAEVRRRDQAFFIAFAQAFGSAMTDAGLRAQLAGDHAPESCRMNTVRNLDAWYEAFDVVPGQRLYVAPADRVTIW